MFNKDVEAVWKIINQLPDRERCALGLGLSKIDSQWLDSKGFHEFAHHFENLNMEVVNGWLKELGVEEVKQQNA